MTDEMIRRIRTSLQAALGTAVAGLLTLAIRWLTDIGLPAMDIDITAAAHAIAVPVATVAMAVIVGAYTAAVQWAEVNISSVLGVLNGPRRDVHYTPPANVDITAEVPQTPGGHTIPPATD